MPGVLAKLDPEVTVDDEPTQLPCGGVHQGSEVFVQSILGAMMGYANVAVTEAEVFEGPAGVVGTLTGTLTAQTTGEKFPLTMVEIHQVEDGTVRKIEQPLVPEPGPEGRARPGDDRRAGSAWRAVIRVIN